MTILVTSYTNADADGVACSVAYAELLNLQGRPAVAAIGGLPTLEARYVAERLGVPVAPLPVPHGEVILTDVCWFNKMHPSVAADSVVEVVDHRTGGRPQDFPNIRNFQIEMVGAAATIITEKWQAACLEPQASTARLLQAAIISNTMDFKAAVTTDRDHAAFAWLAGLAPLPSGFVHDMFAAKSDLAGDRLQEALWGELSNFAVGTRNAAYIQLEIVGVKEMLAARGAEIRAMLGELMRDKGFDTALASFNDLEAGTTDFILPEPGMAATVSRLVGAPLDGDAIHIGRIVLRKQLRGRIQEL